MRRFLNITPIFLELHLKKLSENIIRWHEEFEIQFTRALESCSQSVRLRTLFLEAHFWFPPTVAMPFVVTAV